MVNASPADEEFHSDPYAQARARMVTGQIERRGITNPRVLGAMRRVPRHEFVPPEYRDLAYTDGPLYIGHDQTISQPYIVALMTALMAPTPEDRVLDVGAGSGYQTAILCELARELIGIERIPQLADNTAVRRAQLGYANTLISVGDGSQGYAEAAPYQGIVVGAASPAIPQPLLDQLADGGRLVIPVGNKWEQMLERVTRRGGSFHIERLTAVRFVPLLGEHGF